MYGSKFKIQPKMTAAQSKRSSSFHLPLCWIYLEFGGGHFGQLLTFRPEIQLFSTWLETHSSALNRSYSADAIQKISFSVDRFCYTKSTRSRTSKKTIIFGLWRRPFSKWPPQSPKRFFVSLLEAAILKMAASRGRK